ncbi:DUF3822 family protein [Marivirga sp. S37H4]|uniref:DUF3822 family protein n=1 Tax=Marivirga aurantiaca TaxID=2802615 RepID=A0A934WVG1_9BACT|nr:DUF3822 family protein [Marivirga aurantiaca]MBK6263676.1 DUF3822 family protein [Marivirga aurantiaca]
MIAAKSTSFKQIKKVKDDKFSIEKIEQYCLILQIGSRDLQVSIIDSKTNRVLFLEDYIIDATDNPEDKIELLKSLFDHHHLLMVGFWKEVILCFKTDKFTVVPLSFFSKENARPLLKMNCPVEDSDSVGYYKINSNDSVNIFTYDKAILQWFRSIYINSKIKVTHQSGMIINSVLKNSPFPDDVVVSLYIDRFYLHAAVSKKDQLLFFNSFKISKFDEYIKFINLVLHEFKMSKTQSLIKVWGYINEESNHFNSLKKHFPTIKIGNRTTVLNFGYKFDEVPEHQYFDVFGNYFNL